MYCSGIYHNTKEFLLNRHMTFYVYQIIDPRTEQPFYIGKGKKNRAWSHLLKEDDVNLLKQNKITSIRKNGSEPIVQIIKSDLSEVDAFALEVTLISKYGRIGIEENGILTNRCKGGSGGDTSEFFTKESKRKISVANTGTSNPNSKLSEDNVKTIYKSTDTNRELSLRFGISNSSVAAIKRGMSYRSITMNLGEPGFHSNSKRKPLIPETVKEIFQFYGTTKKLKERFGVSVTVARNIKYRITYGNITEDLGDPGELVIYNLDWDQICEIRVSDDSAALLAERFSVDRQTIYNIRSGKTRRLY